jgi:hypothetical protein
VTAVKYFNSYEPGWVFTLIFFDICYTFGYTLFRIGGTSMATIKTAISIDKSLLDQLGVLANETNTSRSRIFALAAEEFIQRHRNQKLLEDINAAYDGFEDNKESSLNAFMRSKHINMVDDKW